MKKILIKRIKDFIEENYPNFCVTDEDINCIFYMLVGRHDYLYDRINDNEISYIIDTYYDNGH